MNRTKQAIGAAFIVGAVTRVSQGGGNFAAAPVGAAGLEAARSEDVTAKVGMSDFEGKMWEFGQRQKASLVPGKAESIVVAQPALDF